jgi:hypothetical protein
MTKYTPSEWYDIAEKLYKIIDGEMERIDSLGAEELPMAYPKMVVMYEFFRLIRGEAFLDVRQPGMGDKQKDLYRMEDELLRKLNSLKQKLDPKDKRTSFYLKEFKKRFDL